MAIFERYAPVYDLVYRDRRCERDVAFVESLVERASPGRATQSLLDLGCGTAAHLALLAGRPGLAACGVDRSAAMLAAARARLDAGGPRPDVELHLGDAREIRLGRRFDVVTALFHVLSYMESDDDVARFLRTVEAHLGDEGVAIVDHWSGPAVLAQRPERRVAEVEQDGRRVVRTATPTLDLARSVVEVRYEFRVEGSERPAEFQEVHRMRYFAEGELGAFAARAGLRVIESGAWLTGDAPGPEHWGVYAVMRRITRESS